MSGDGERNRPGLTLGRSALPFLWIGGLAIVAGGVVSAVTSPLRLEHGSWAAAYLVLIVGVALILLGAAQSRLVSHVGAAARAVELGGWLLGSAAVIGGTLIGMPLVVDTGGILLLISLVAFVVSVRRPSTASAGLLWLFRIVVAIIIVSIPIGLVLSHVRHG